MAEATAVGIIGAGWPGAAHARGYVAAGGYELVAVADLIPERRRKLMEDHGIAREYGDAMELLADKDIEAVSICLPNALHAEVATAALRRGKHVICEMPPATSIRAAQRMAAAAAKAKRVLLYSAQRRFGAAEQSARAAIEKGYGGEFYHGRASWTRTRGIPLGTGWYTVKEQSGGGALIDVGLHMIDLAWYLLGEPRPIGVFGIAYQNFTAELPDRITSDVEDAAFALIRFEGGKSLELAASWAINQPPSQNGTACRLHGTEGALDVYTPQGAVLYRNFDAAGEPRQTPLKGPRLSGHASMMRHFRECIGGGAKPSLGGAQGVTLMQIVQAIYKSCASGKSVKIEVKS